MCFLCTDCWRTKKEEYCRDLTSHNNIQIKQQYENKIIIKQINARTTSATTKAYCKFCVYFRYFD